MGQESILQGNIYAFLSAVENNALPDAEIYFLRCVEKEISLIWTEISVENQQDFLLAAIKWINLNKGWKIKNLTELNQYYCNLTEVVINYFTIRLQAKCLRHTAKFYLAQDDYFTALIGYARSYRLVQKKSLLEKINNLIEQNQQFYLRINTLSKKRWKEYLSFLASIKSPPDEALFLEKAIAEFTQLAALFSKEKHRILLNALYQNEQVLALIDKWTHYLIRTLCQVENTSSSENIQNTSALTQCQQFIRLLSTHGQFNLALQKCRQWRDFLKNANSCYWQEFQRLEHTLQNNSLTKKVYPHVENFTQKIIVFDWQSSQAELIKFRADFNKNVANKMSIFTAQVIYSQNLTRWLNQLITAIVALLGKPPTNFCFMVGGSLGRQNAIVSSDIDIAILIADEHYRIHPYWYSLIKNLEICLTAMGGPIIIKNGAVIQNIGLHIDKGDFSYLFNENPLLIQTPKSLAQWVVAECSSKIDDHNKNSLFELAYGLLASTAIYCFDSSAYSLHAEYLTQLSQFAPEDFFTKILHNLTFTVYRPVQLTHFKEISLDTLKQYFIKPLILWVMGLPWYKKKSFDLNQLNIIQILTKAKHKKWFTESWLQFVENALLFVEQLRHGVLSSKDSMTSAPLLLSNQQRKTLKNLSKYLFLAIYESPSSTLWHENNPCADYFHYHLTQWWQEDEATRSELWPSLRLALYVKVYYLANVKAPLVRYYETLLDLHVGFQRQGVLTIEQAICLRSEFRKAVKKFFTNKEEINALENLLDEFPFPDGSRPQVNQQQLLWQQELQAAFCIENSTHNDVLLPPLKVTMVTQNIQGNYQRSQFTLHPVIVKTLLAQNKLRLKNNQYVFVVDHSENKTLGGRHFVIEINFTLADQPIHWFLKLSPEMPGLEYAGGSFCRRLIGWGMPFVTLVRLHLADGDCPALISRAVVGENLAHYLHPIRLNHKYYSQRWLASVFLQPEDSKPENNIAEKLNDDSMRIWSIDNERVFFPPIQIDSKTGQLTPLVKEIIYCYAEMAQPVAPEAQAEFLVLAPPLVLNNWLCEIEQFNQQLSTLFTEQEIRQFFAPATWLNSLKNYFNQDRRTIVQSSLLTLPIRKGLVEELYRRWHYLREQFITQPLQSHAQLFSQLENLLAKYYHYYRHKYAKELPQTRFMLAFAKYYVISLSEEEILAYFHNKQLLQKMVTQSIKIESLQTVAGYNFAANNWIYTTTQNLAQAQKELRYLQSVWPTLSVIKQQLLRNEPEGIAAFEKLAKGEWCDALIHSSNFAWGHLQEEVQVRLLKKLTHRPINFTRLIMSNCKMLDDENLQILVISPLLTHLDISGCSTLTNKSLNILAQCQRLSVLKANRLIQFTQLNWKFHQTWSPLEPGLTHLMLEENPRLITLNVIARGIKRLYLTDCTYLKNLSITSEQCPKIYAAGCWELETISNILGKEYKRQVESYEEKSVKNKNDMQWCEKLIELINKDNYVKAFALSQKYEVYNDRIFLKKSIKILLIGGSCGKRSLSVRLAKNTFPKPQITIGLMFYGVSLSIQESEIKIHVWHGGGVEECINIVMPSVRGSDAVVLCVDLTDPQDELSKKWLNATRKYGEYDLPIFLAGCKADLAEQRVVSRQQMIEFQQQHELVDYFECSAKTGAGVKEMFEKMVEKIIEEKISNKTSGIMPAVLSLQEEIAANEKKLTPPRFSNGTDAFLHQVWRPWQGIAASPPNAGSLFFDRKYSFPKEKAAISSDAQEKRFNL